LTLQIVARGCAEIDGRKCRHDLAAANGHRLAFGPAIDTVGQGELATATLEHEPSIIDPRILDSHRSHLTPALESDPFNISSYLVQVALASENGTARRGRPTASIGARAAIFPTYLSRLRLSPRETFRPVLAGYQRGRWVSLASPSRRLEE
jgi:hypothetical protein